MALRVRFGKYCSTVHRGMAHERIYWRWIYRMPCHWCGSLLHRSRWVCDRLDQHGTYRRDNVVPACYSCNNLRAAGNVLVPYSLVVYAMMEV